MIEIRRATPWDTIGIIEVKQKTWPSQTTSALQIATVLGDANNFTFVAVHNDRAIGYMSCFQTTSIERHKRWELDELAVHPDYRQQGLAYKLIGIALKVGRQQSVDLYRALIQVDNVASQRAFATHGFACNDDTLQLWVCSELQESFFPISMLIYTIEVNTLSYHGIWIEGKIDAKTLDNARENLQRPDVSVLGALLPATDEKLQTDAKKLGYEWVGSYQWWAK